MKGHSHPEKFIEPVVLRVVNILNKSAYSRPEFLVGACCLASAVW